MDLRSKSTDIRISRAGIAPTVKSAAPCRRLLGGEHRLHCQPRQGRQPPEAGAAGPPLRGWPCSHTGPPKSAADHRETASSAIPARAQMRSSNDRKRGRRARPVSRFRHRNGCEFDRYDSVPSSGRFLNICIAVAIRKAGIGPPVSKRQALRMHRIDAYNSIPVLAIEPRDDIRHVSHAPFGCRHLAMSIAQNHAPIAVRWHVAECLFDRRLSWIRARTTERRGTARLKQTPVCCLLAKTSHCLHVGFGSSEGLASAHTRWRSHRKLQVFQRRSRRCRGSDLKPQETGASCQAWPATRTFAQDLAASAITVPACVCGRFLNR